MLHTTMLLANLHSIAKEVTQRLNITAILSACVNSDGSLKAMGLNW
jgi:hypothetical protein